MTPKKILLLGFFALLLLYALFEARFLIVGPYIKISSHQDGAQVDQELVNLSGRAMNAAWFTLNDRQIFTDKKGYFYEELILGEGPNVLTFKARDRFGRERVKRLEIIVKYRDDKEENQGTTTPRE